MAPSATIDLPLPSPLEEALSYSKTDLGKSVHAPYLHHLASTILHNLQFQHSWTALKIHTHSPLTLLPLPRPIISGLPPKRAYIHPDEQISTLKAEHSSGQKIEQFPELEWVLPSQIQENWSLKKFAEVFDALGVVPPSDAEDEGELDEKRVGWQWRGENRQKRVLLATLHDDSTVVYYIMHDGIVKPRQN
jgi:tRNA-splicing endonuclease subunit Sen15